VHIQRLEINASGCDYVVGDVHGNFELLEHLLKKVNFNMDKDRLISVGDLVDRGPQSERVVEYLDQPWFFATKGNHEELLTSALAKEPGIQDLWMRVGGRWANDVEIDFLKSLGKRFETLPYVIEIDTLNGLVGVVHADVPFEVSWSQLVAELEKKKPDAKLLKSLIWSRERHNKLNMKLQYPGSVKTKPVDDVHRVYVGHNIVNEARSMDNVVFLDTGAFCNGILTMANLDTEEFIQAHFDELL